VVVVTSFEDAALINSFAPPATSCEPSVGSTGNVVKIRFGSYVRVTRYLCASCGFSEEWIDTPSDISKLRAKFG
jgi:hypothetical protein